MGRVNFTIEDADRVDCLSTTQSPSAVYVESISDYLCSGDTIRIRPSCICHELLGRIIDISMSYDCQGYPAHPYITEDKLAQNKDFCFLLQLYIPSQHHIFEGFGTFIPTPSTALREIHIPEVVESNLVTWVCPSQISNIVFFHASR